MSFPDSFRRTVLGRDDIFAADYNFVQSDVGGEWLRSLTVAASSAWCRQVDPEQDSWLPALGVGISVSRLDGIAHFDLDPRSTIETTRLPSAQGGEIRRLSVRGHYTFTTSAPDRFEPARAIVRPGFTDSDSSSGAGWGGNIGISTVLLRTVRHLRDVLVPDPLNPGQTLRNEVVTRDAITLGLAVDEIGGVEWEGRNLRRTREFDTIWTSRRGEGITYDALSDFTGVLDTIGGFRTSLPTTARIGVGVDLTAFLPQIEGDLLASLEGAFPLNDAIGSERTPRVALGLAWRPVDWLVLRSGVQGGGKVGGGWSVGAGIRPLRWLTIDAATSEITSLWASNPDRYDLAIRIATGVRF